VDVARNWFRPDACDQFFGNIEHGFYLSLRVILALKTCFAQFSTCNRATGRRDKPGNSLTPQQVVMMGQDHY